VFPRVINIVLSYVAQVRTYRTYVDEKEKILRFSTRFRYVPVLHWYLVPGTTGTGTSYIQDTKVHRAGGRERELLPPKFVPVDDE
jgi:hypothetical protein